MASWWRMLSVTTLSLFCVILTVYAVKYEPNWKSIDSRPLPGWYDEAKFGIFLHWGVFSVPSLNDEWFWHFWKVDKVKEVVDYMDKFYPPTFTYQDFAAQFKAEFYDPNRWVEIFKAAGAKYAVLTTKHHEGYCNWPSKHSWNWNSQDVGPKRDLVGEFVSAIRNNSDIHVGLYHSLYEWFNPLYLQDEKNKWATRDFCNMKTFPELYELVNWYKPDLIWSDYPRGPDSYWNSTSFLAWLYNESPVKDSVVVNDRWFFDQTGTGADSKCRHGGYYTCADRFNPKYLFPHKFEGATSVDKRSWGYRRNIKLSELYTTEELISLLVQIVSCGGNLLLNVGPTEAGVIPTIFEERLKEIGSWLKVNGEAIYASKPWVHQNDTVTPYVWYTSKKFETGWSVYAITLEWPSNNKLTLASVTPTSNTNISLLGYAGKFEYKIRPQGGIDVLLPVIPFNQIPCKWAWTFRIDNLKF